MKNYRIGNCIQHTWIAQNGKQYDIIKIHGIIKDHGIIVDSNMLPEYETIKFRDVKHIPVTPQILESLKFFKDDSSNCFRHCKRYELVIVYHGKVDGGIWECHLYYGKVAIGFRYLHELQNIYFTLFRDEFDLTLLPGLPLY